MARKTSDKGIGLIKEFEGCSLAAYRCPAGVWTIGYGHTGKVDGKAVSLGMRITQTKAAQLLREDLASFEAAVNAAVKTLITQNMFDALVSFSYNCGAGALRNSTLLRKLNAGDYLGAADEFPKWNKAGGKVLNGLVRRREAERKLFLNGATDVTEEFKIGDSVILNGYLYIDSYASVKGRLCSKRKAKVTKVAPSADLRKAPYLLDDGLGWARGEDLTRV